MKTTNEKLEEIKQYIEDILSYDKYMKLKEFNHHWEYSIFDHCVNVAYHSFKLAKKLGLDYVSVVRGGMLHDFFLYNWKTDSPKDQWHGLVHPTIAYNNAIEKFELNKIEKDIILKHMFPLTLRPPKYFETIIVCMIDKICATIETFNALNFRFKNILIQDNTKINIPQFIYSFMYIFLIFKI